MRLDLSRTKLVENLTVQISYSAKRLNSGMAKCCFRNNRQSTDKPFYKL